MKAMSVFVRRLLKVGAGAWAGFALTAGAADYTWLASPATGNWNLTDANWSGAGSVWANASANNALFGPSATLSITADAIVASNVTFNADGYSIGGGPLDFASRITVTNGVTATLTAPLVHSSTNLVFYKFGAGSLVMSAPAASSNVLASFRATEGTWLHAGGTTVVTKASTNPESAPLFWVNGGTLVVGGGLLKTTGNNYARVSESGRLIITNGTVDLNANSELLNGHNTPGITTVSHGGVLDLKTLRISQNFSAAALTAININTGGTIRLNQFGLDTSSAKNGTVNFNGGMIVAKDTVNQLDMLGTTNINWRNIVVNVLAGGAVINNNGCSFYVRQNMAGTPGDGGLTKLGGGSLLQRGTNTYTGATTLKGGGLNIIRDHNLGAAPSAPATNILFLANATLQSSDNHTLDANRTVLITNAVTATFDTQTYTQTIRGAIVGAETNAVLLKGGTGTLILDPGPASGINVGTLRCTAGTLAVVSGTNFVTAGNRGQNQPGVWISGGTLLVGGGLLKATQPMFINIDGGALLVTNGLADFSTQNELLNAIGAYGWTTVSGSGVLDVKALRISQLGGYPSNAVVNVNTGGVLRINNFYIDIGATQKGLLNLNGGTVVAKGTTADFLGTTAALVGNANDKWLTNITVNVLQGGAIFHCDLENHIKQPLYGAVPNDGGLIKRGAGVLLLANTNTYSGATRVEGGILRLYVNNTLRAGGAAWVGTNATFDVNNKAQALSLLGGSGLVENNTLLTVAGEVAPGDAGSYGTLTLASPCALSGSLTVDVAADGSCDRLHVAGDLSLSGLSLNVADAGQLNKDHTYMIASYTGALSSTFGAVALPPRWFVRHDAAAKQVLLVYNPVTVVIVQ